MNETEVKLRCSASQKLLWEEAAGPRGFSRWTRDVLDAAAASTASEETPAPVPTALEHPQSIKQAEPPSAAQEKANACVRKARHEPGKFCTSCKQKMNDVLF